LQAFLWLANLSADKNLSGSTNAIERLDQAVTRRRPEGVKTATSCFESILSNIPSTISLLLAGFFMAGKPEG
tara:strand:- start:127792 stop:128007 length:216 start_codon:yes stop_codon:yes gene_type:complete